MYLYFKLLIYQKWCNKGKWNLNKLQIKLVKLCNNWELYIYLFIFHSYLTIAELHREHWQEECFFKWIKQLHIKLFCGASQNVAFALILIDISDYLLLAIAKKVFYVGNSANSPCKRTNNISHWQAVSYKLSKYPYDSHFETYLFQYRYILYNQGNRLWYFFQYRLLAEISSLDHQH